jgi:hypothetical protein
VGDIVSDIGEMEGGWREGEREKERTVLATAAGTLNITLMIEFRLRSMNIVARRFERKLRQKVVC